MTRVLKKGQTWRVIQGDCLTSMSRMPDNSIDSIVTDPPYGLKFMGKDWDHGVPGSGFWKEALRVAKPGTHMLAFGGTRTFHRLAVAIEDAGWEIRDCVMWTYGSGFPKSHDVSKAIDRTLGEKPTIVGLRVFADGTTRSGGPNAGRSGKGIMGVSVPRDPAYETIAATREAATWEGWGTALKPAWEPIVLARKPIEGTIAQNVLKHGVGGINVDGCRVPTCDNLNGGAYSNHSSKEKRAVYEGGLIGSLGKEAYKRPSGRWPANLIHDGSPEVLDLFPVSKDGVYVVYVGNNRGEWSNNTIFGGRRSDHKTTGYGSGGSAARFFYCAKASSADRDEGLSHFAKKPSYMVENGSKTAKSKDGVRRARTTTVANNHPTVKPTDLMRYLCRLITPPNGIILDPFTGSGSTGKAALLEGFRFVGIELQSEYVTLAEARISHAYVSTLSERRRAFFKKALKSMPSGKKRRLIAWARKRRQANIKPSPDTLMRKLFK